MLLFFKTLLITLLSLLGVFRIGMTDAPVDAENGGDPVIVESDGSFYYTYTTGGGVDICKIADYNDVAVLERKTVYRSGADGITGAIWAPELHKIGDNWYILSCAVFDANTAPRGTMPQADANTDMAHDDFYRYGFVLKSKTEDVFGEYEFMGMLAPDGLNNIDGTYLQKDGKLYYVCSAYMNVGNQHLYITEMSDPCTLATDENGKHNAVCISSPQFSWEKQGWSVNEGPAVLYHGEDVFIVYSASGFSSGGYCMGMLTLNGDDVLSADNWLKSPVPVFRNRPMQDVYNAGHCSFLYLSDGSVQIVYHATSDKEFGNAPRLTHVKPVQFICGVPVF